MIRSESLNKIPVLKNNCNKSYGSTMGMKRKVSDTELILITKD